MVRIVALRVGIGWNAIDDGEVTSVYGLFYGSVLQYRQQRLDNVDFSDELA